MLALGFTLCIAFLNTGKQKQLITDRSCDFVSSQCDGSHFLPYLLYSFLKAMFFLSRLGPCFSCITMMIGRVRGKNSFLQTMTASLHPSLYVQLWWQKHNAFLSFLMSLGHSWADWQKKASCSWWQVFDGVAKRSLHCMALSQQAAIGLSFSHSCRRVWSCSPMKTDWVS